MRPARRFDRENSVAGMESITAIERLRDALDPGQLRELLDRRRGEPNGDPDAA